MSKVEIVKGQDNIRNVIGAIAGKAKAYKTVISSAILSAYQHYRLHGDYTLLQEALDTVFSINYRDYSAVADFVRSYTELECVTLNQGRRQRVEIAGTIESQMERPENMSMKDWNAKLESKRSEMIIRNGRFDDFATGKPIPMKNPNWVQGMPKDEKQEGVVYDGDIFAWHDDVKWLRTAAPTTGGESTENLRELPVEQAVNVAVKLEDRVLKSSNKPVFAVLIHMMERFEAETGVYATDEEIETFQRRVNALLERTKARSESKAEREAAEKQAAQENSGEQVVTTEQGEPLPY